MKFKRLFVLGLASLLLSSCGISLPSKESSQSSNNTSKPSVNVNTTPNYPNSITVDSNAPTSGDVELSIIELNDIHGYAYEAESSRSKGYSLANAAFYVNQIRKQKEYDNVVLIANGDTFQGTAFSNLSHGASVIKAMNTMDFDMMGIGNHEFDWTLDEILKYWDGDQPNVEANFPLINGNVRDTNDGNKLVGESNIYDFVLPYKIVNKGGINVGLISYIGDQTNSICANKFGSYYIDCHGSNDSSFVSKVKAQAEQCKKDGADVIVLNFHEGNSNGVSELAYNHDFANMKDANGDYLIDAVINGHTHTKQSGEITRTGGNPLPIVQASSYCNAIGTINLTIDGESKKVKSVSERTNYINEIIYKYQKAEETQKVLDEEYGIIQPQIAEVLGNSNGATKAQLGEWAGNIMKKYTGADVAFMNTGGIRSALSDGDITMEELYAINPFDNSLCLVEVSGLELKNFCNKNEGQYYFNTGFNVSSISTTKTYKVTTIDFVYYGYYFTSAIKNGKEVKIDNSTCARDLMYKDLKARTNKNVDFSSSTVYLKANSWPK